MKPSEHPWKIVDDAPAFTADHNRIEGREIAEPKLAPIFTCSHENRIGTRRGLVNVPGTRWLKDAKDMSYVHR